MLISIMTMQITAFAEDNLNLDLSVLSEVTENTSESHETYSYEWTVEEVDGETVRRLELTLDGADIETLTLPCKTDGIINVAINTESDSRITEISESHVFSYSYQWDTITFDGGGKLEVEYMNTQGAGNDHIITVSEGANLYITGDSLYALSFGASGSNGSTLNVEGFLSANGNILCGQAIIGAEGHLICKRAELAGQGAFDGDVIDAFVLEDGGKFEALGDTDWIDDESGEQYAALSVVVPYDDATPVEEIINLPENTLPDGYSLYKADNYFATIDDGDEEPQTGVIYAATSLKLGFPAETFTVKFVNEDGTELQSEELEYGETPEYKRETPEKEADAEFTYTFAGWTPDIEAVTTDATYTASYMQTPIEPTVHTVTFNSNGGSDVADTSVNDGEKLTKPANPTRRGYSFKGWYEDEALTSEYDFESEVGTSFTLYAKWKKKSTGSGNVTTRYTVKFDTDGGSELSKATVTRDARLTEPEEPTKDGHTFDGWYTDKEFAVSYDFDSPVTKDFTLYAKWTKPNVSGMLNTEEHFAYIKGYHDNTVRPENHITRAETTEIFYRLLNEETRNKNLSREHDFEDADAAAWYNTAVSTMAKLGIIKGKTSVSFAPEHFITRAEFAAICARFDRNDFEITDEFSDISGHWAEKEIYEAAAHGWIKGYEDGKFRPDEYITRAEAISMINRMLNRTPKTVEDLHDNMIKWLDNSDESAWYYIAIQEATNDHSYTKTTDGNEKWTDNK